MALSLSDCAGSTAKLQRDLEGTAPEAPTIDENALSRQLAVFGHGGQAKIKDAHVLISGMGAVGVEIAKNIALSGVKVS